MHVTTVDYQSKDAGQAFCDSLKNTGFAVISNHHIDHDLVDSVYKEWADFFESDEKHKYPFDHAKQDGYVPMELSEKAKGATLKDLKEFYHLYFPWGRYPDCLTEKTKTLFQDLFTTATTLLNWVEANTPKHYLEHMQCSLSDTISIDRSLFRIIYYPALAGVDPNNALRAAAHEDINLLTLLNASTEPGLQAQDADGNWHDVGYNCGDLIINAGDMLQECTGHYYRSTTHRVINPSNEKQSAPRMSMPLFLHPHKDVHLSEKYPSAEHYLQERLHELGLVNT